MSAIHIALIALIQALTILQIRGCRTSPFNPSQGPPSPGTILPTQPVDEIERFDMTGKCKMERVSKVVECACSIFPELDKTTYTTRAMCSRLFPNGPRREACSTRFRRATMTSGRGENSLVRLYNRVRAISEDCFQEFNPSPEAQVELTPEPGSVIPNPLPVFERCVKCLRCLNIGMCETV